MLGQRLHSRPLASSTLKLYDNLRRRSLTPRSRLGVRLWAAGVGTKKEIATALGMHPTTMYLTTMPSIQNSDVRDIVKRVDDALEQETVDMGKVLQIAGRRAVRQIVSTMENGQSEVLRFKAAQDLADRNPETSKTQKVAVASFSLGTEDVQDLARAMVEAARVRQECDDATKSDFVKIDADARVALPAHAQRIADRDGG